MEMITKSNENFRASQTHKDTRELHLTKFGFSRKKEKKIGHRLVFFSVFFCVRGNKNDGNRAECYYDGVFVILRLPSTKETGRACELCRLNVWKPESLVCAYVCACVCT